MKNIKIFILGGIALFYGIYAMILELRGTANDDQLLFSMIFGVMTALSKCA